MIWFTEPLLAKEIAIVPIEFNGAQFSSNFELYGCSYWDALGKVSYSYIM